MQQIRLHGLGGQGVVSTAHLLGKAAMFSGLWANSLPFFSTAQRGGKVVAYTRIDSSRIDDHCYIYEPDILVVFHSSLLQEDEILKGVKSGTKILISVDEQTAGVMEYTSLDTFCLDGEHIARSILGIPVPSTVMAGAILKIFPQIPFANLAKAIEGSFPQKYIEKNVRAAEEGLLQCKMKTLEGKP